MDSFDFLYWIAAFFAFLAAGSLGALLWLGREPRRGIGSRDGKGQRSWLPARP